MSETIEVRGEPSALRVALVGCGNVARKHVAALRALGDELEVVGAVDPDGEARRETAQALQTAEFEDLKTLLATEPVDLVSLATPTGLHPEQAVEAAEAGADVLTEKPLGTSLEHARQMVGRLDELQRRLFVVKQLRHHPLFDAVRRAVQQGRFGRIYTVGMQIFWTRPQAYYDSSAWRGTRRFDGGALMNQASHYVDLMDWLFGPVARVHAIGGALGRAIEVEDTAVVSLSWTEGFVGSLHVTMLTYPKNIATNLTVIGEQGTVRLGGMACEEVEVWEFADTRPVDQQLSELSSQVFPALRCGHRSVYQGVAATLRGEAGAVVSGRDGLRSLAIIDAAYRALNQGTTATVTPVEFA